jgi:formylglycine-generating enzyme
MTRAAVRAVAVIGLWPMGVFAGQSPGEKGTDLRPEGATLRTRAIEPSKADHDMALIPGATFQMGIDETDLPRFQKLFGIRGAQLFEPEMPKHWVTIDSFYIDRKLVTNAQFKKFIVGNSGWRVDRITSSLHNGHYLEHWKGNEIPTGREDHPVVNVSWYAAVAYCRSVGKRLPSEAEWEFAAKGQLNGVFPWGDSPAEKTRANFSDSGIGSTSAVGSYPANGYGLFDMAGNAWEYLADEWGSYQWSAQKNPIADQDRFLQVKTRRVIRGGSWGGAPINLWVDYRDSHPPEGAKDFVGFRCAKSLPN